MAGRRNRVLPIANTAVAPAVAPTMAASPPTRPPNTAPPPMVRKTTPGSAIPAASA